MTGKYLLYITKMHAVITQMQEVYAYVLTLLVKSLHSTDHLYDCHNTNLLGLQHTCINLQDIDIENAETYFNLHLQVAPLEYQNVFKISCAINQTNTSIINDLHLKIFSLKSLRLLHAQENFRPILDSDLLDASIIIVHSDTSFGLSCQK